MRHISWIMGLLFSGMYFSAFAADTGYPTDAELRTLPAYCTAKLRGEERGSSEAAYWAGIMGPGFIHVHHLCQGLNLINRYYKAKTAYARQYYLQASLPEFAYMITHTEPTSSLMPEVYLNRGVALWKLGRVGPAIADFQKAIQLNPKIPRSYAVFGDFYVERKLRAEALATLTEGLKHIPDSKMLQRRYIELGGKKPFPEPYRAAANEQAAAARSSNNATPAPQEKTNTKEASKPASRAAETGSDQSAPPPVIGMPGNPWCRFCPDPAPANERAGTPASPGIQP